MALPPSERDLVIAYAHLWHEHAQGREVGIKTHPCVIVLAVERAGGNRLVTAAPVVILRRPVLMKRCRSR